jgi:hypothetical protein
MNNLTQQQINQYQWQSADGVVRIISRNEKQTGGLLIVPGPAEREAWKLLSEIMKFESNAPDGIYSGEAFEVIKQMLPYGRSDYEWIEISDVVDEHIFLSGNNNKTRQFLRFKPSHLPAVLTTQTGEEWKDRYTSLYEYYNAATDKWAECDESHGHPVYPARTTWHLITPPAEQEAETVEPSSQALTQKVQAYFDKYGEMFSKQAFYIAGYMQCEQDTQSTLTQKDQRIAELERLLSKFEGYLVISNKSCKDRGDRIAELEREREWISADKRKPTKYGDYWVYRASCKKQHKEVWNNTGWAYNNNTITHWQPLPTPPQH